MQINWFTVIAQAINFLVLVWLLKKFLYKPILKAVDDREKKIAAQVKDANDLKAEAKIQQEDLAKKNAGFDAQKEDLLDKAVTDANRQRQQLLDDAKTEAAQLGAKLAAASNEKQQTENTAIRQKIQEAVFTITRKALTEIASESLEEQSASIFIKRLNELKDEEKKQFTDAFSSYPNAILIRSAFDLTVTKQHDISKAIDDLLGTKTQLQFKTVSDIISGIELSTNGYKLAWSFSNYLNELQKSIAVTVTEKSPKDQKERAVPDINIDVEKKGVVEKRSIAVNGVK